MPAATDQNKNPYNLFKNYGAAEYVNIDQQTFLGASIRSFSANAGFGDTSSTLNVDLIVDVYNTGDGTVLGDGQDVYHRGLPGDNFKPPPAGSPVFFTLGQTFGTVNNVFRRAYDTFYSTAVVPNTAPFYHHFFFGGILQSYIQTRSPQGNPLFSVQVVDPREILSSTTMILNNYSNSVFKQYNLINVYGFLEFNTEHTISHRTHSKIIKSNSSLFETSSLNELNEFTGNDIWAGVTQGFETPTANAEEAKNLADKIYGFRFLQSHQHKPSYYGAGYTVKPMTGTGFSRRNDQGMPYYRICHALNALFGHYGELPDEYVNSGFFRGINFRGLNYIVDLSDLPNIPPFYYFDYDQITLLDFCLEVCEISNHDLYISLLPVIQHPACQLIYDNQPPDIKQNIVGVIKVSTIDRSKPLVLSSIKNFIDEFPSDKVSASDVGYELTNSVTDKVLIGANEVNNYYFKGEEDRDLDIEDIENWKISNTLKKGIIPYYGLLANKAVTLPVGEGSYQQILLDSSGLYANGVGKYYVATEMELRAALVSFESWQEFLMFYNDIYLEIVVDGDIKSPDATGSPKVTVPRCAYPNVIASEAGFNGQIPKNPCHPPLGYPLYWHRATEIGVPQAGLVGSASFNLKIVEITAELKNASRKKQQALVNSAIDQLKSMDTSRLTNDEKTFYDNITTALENGSDLQIIDKFHITASAMLSAADSQRKKNMKNVMRVYNFVKAVADECLGKKFLVKIPQITNRDYNVLETYDSDTFDPFGFPCYEMSDNVEGSLIVKQYGSVYPAYLTDREEDFTDGKYGALTVNKDPFKNTYKYNYVPEPLGGYFPFIPGQDGGARVEKLRKAGLAPADLSTITGDNSRILPYAIFSNSQELSLSSLSTDVYTQQAAEGLEFTVDYAYQMDNSSSNVPSLIDVVNNTNSDSELPETVAFITCSLDNKFYMPPKISAPQSTTYYGQYTQSAVKRKPRQYTDKKTGQQKSFKLPDVTIYKPSNATAGSVVLPKIDLSYLYDGLDFFKESDVTEFIYDSKHVYALITLPGRIEATISKKYRDVKELSDQGLKHNMMLDVTHLFTQPEIAVAGNKKTPVYSNDEIADSDSGFTATEFDKAVQKTSSSLVASFPNRISMKVGSPVYPDFVSIPLMSMERSYGPWMSSYQAGDIIGGNIEFSKDERLAPWNYAGYELMNNAAKLISGFGFSSQVTQERGSITLAGPPSGGVALGAELISAGPIVSTINVNVSEAGVTTVYKMDQFTASFGKLNKSKEQNISAISREKQKSTDERNALIRKDLGKNATKDTYSIIYKEMRNEARERANKAMLSHPSINGSKPAKTFVLTSNNQTEQMPTSDPQNPIKSDNIQFSSSILDENNEILSSEILSRNPDNQSRQYTNSVSCNLEDFMIPASMEPGHQAMSSAYVANNKAHTKHYSDEDSYTLEAITYWRN